MCRHFPNNRHMPCMSFFVMAVSTAMNAFLFVSLQSICLSVIEPRHFWIQQLKPNCPQWKGHFNQNYMIELIFLLHCQHCTLSNFSFPSKVKNYTLNLLFSEYKWSGFIENIYLHSLIILTFNNMSVVILQH